MIPEGNPFVISGLEEVCPGGVTILDWISGGDSYVLEEEGCVLGEDHHTV